jgi:undecaprenyl-diphosphatase
VWRPVVNGARETIRELLPVLRHPVKTAELLGGGVVFLVLSAYGLVATLTAFGAEFSVLPVMAVFVVGSTLGQLLPTPGGLGAVEGALIAGLTAVGIQPADAIAAALTARVLTFWLPVLPGVITFRVLQHRGVV